MEAEDKSKQHMQPQKQRYTDGKEKRLEERRRAIKLRLQHAKAMEALRSPLPHEGTNWLAPEWFGDFPIPLNVETSEGFDTEELVARTEHLRERYVAMLEPGNGGVEILLREKNDLECTLKKDKEQFERDKARTKELIHDIYPKDQQPQLRNMDVLLVNSLAKMVRRPKSEEEAELVKINRRQQVVLGDIHALTPSLWVLENVLNRYRRGLSNTREAWEALYAHFEVSQNELERAFVAEGLLRHDDGLKYYLAETGLQLHHEKPEAYGNRSALLKKMLGRAPTTDIRTLQEQLGTLYPKGETPGRPTKEKEKALYEEMIRRFTTAVESRETGRTEKRGKTGENGTAK